VLGVYEPLIEVSDAGARKTSRASEPQLSATGRTCYHVGCYDPRAAD
jgi:hypothetical protein